MRNAPTFYDWQRRSTPLERQSYYLNDLVTSPLFAAEVRLYDLGGYFRQRARDLRGKLRALARRLTYRRSLTDVAAESVAICGMFGVFFVIGTQTLSGAYSIGSLVMTFQALQRVWTHFGQLTRSLTEVHENDLMLAELFEFFDLAPAVADGSRAAPSTSAPPQVVLEDVCFRYPGASTDTLNHVSLTIQAGQQIALVGHNGSGKSTLIKLLCRLYDPASGKIAVDGVDMREMRLAGIRAMIGVMTQDFVRYEATAADNIRFGRINLPPDDAEVDWAARQSGADAVIRDLPQGYGTMLGSLFAGGHQLSAGQWQKVAIARALIRKPRLLILDEPTSAMDANAEQALFRTFRDIARGCTSVVVSHRLSNITGADCIYVLEEGSIVESGTHGALMARSGLYAHMFELQARGYR
jgi:ATP-binding cassette subfamily B protein